MLSLILMTLKGMMILAASVYGFSTLVRKNDAVWIRRAPLWLFVSMYFIGMWGHTYWVAYFALMLALPIAAKSRGDAAALFAVLIVSLPTVQHLVQFGSLYVTITSKFMFAGFGLTIAFLMNRGKTQVIKRAHLDVPMLIIVVLEASQARDPSATATIRQLVPVFLTIWLPYYVLSRSINTAEEVRRFLLSFTLAGFVMATVAAIEARLHWLIYKQIDALLGVNVIINGYSKMRAGMIRAPASFPESTALATFLVLAFMSALALRDTFGSRAKWLFVLFVLLVGMVSANSRGAFIALGVGLVAWDLYTRRYGRLTMKLVGAGAIYLFALTAAQFSTYFAAMVGKDSGTQGTADYRVQLLRRGLEEIHKHPILGQNMKAALDSLQDLRQGEGIIDLVNGYISYGLTLGYMGIFGLLAVFVTLCLAMLMARRKLRLNPVLIEPAACVFSVAALSIFNSFFTGFGSFGSTTFYEICALGSALWAMRTLAPIVKDGTGQVVRAPLTGTAALIAADRARAAQARDQARDNAALPAPAGG